MIFIYLENYSNFASLKNNNMQLVNNKMMMPMMMWKFSAGYSIC